MVAVISGADNGSLFMPSGVLTFSSPFAILSFYRKQRVATRSVILRVWEAQQVSALEEIWTTMHCLPSSEKDIFIIVDGCDRQDRELNDLYH
jgi:hypothetical protein